MTDDTTDRKTPMVLIVDDDATNLRLLENLLKREKYQIAFARSGKETLAMMENFTPDLILLDIIMPDMNGIEVCRQIKEAPESKDVPIIFLTAKTRIEDFVEGFQAGAADYVTKPFNATELLARVTTQLELKLNRETLDQMNEKLKSEIREKQRIEREKESLERRIGSLSITDDLTELYSYIYVTERLAQEIAVSKRYAHDLSIALFDIDQLGTINDEFGEQTGDEVLVRVAFTIINELREVDIVGRYGGEEFLVILPNTDIEGCILTTERVRKSIESIIWYHDGLKVTLSGGACTLGDEDASELIEKAKKCLKKAKSDGRNRIVTNVPSENGEDAD